MMQCLHREALCAHATIEQQVDERSQDALGRGHECASLYSHQLRKGPHRCLLLCCFTFTQLRHQRCDSAVSDEQRQRLRFLG